MKGHLKSGEIEDMLQKVPIEREAEFGEGKQLRRIFWIVRGEHAGGGGRGLGERLAAVKDGYAHSAPMKFEG